MVEPLSTAALAASPKTFGWYSARLRAGDEMSIVLTDTKSLALAKLRKFSKTPTKRKAPTAAPAGEVRGSASLTHERIAIKLATPAAPNASFYLVKTESLERFAMEVDPNDRTIIFARLMEATLAPGTSSPVSLGKFTLQCVSGPTTRTVKVTPKAGSSMVAVGDLNVRITNAKEFLEVSSPLPDHEAGPQNQRRLREVNYAGARAKPVQNVILFESWSGKRIDDHPRAIHEELDRRKADFRKIFAVADSTVPVPSGYKTVRRWTSEYYSLLGSASAIITNNALTGRYARRPGQISFQTWHGTPLKKIGLDIERVHFHNKNYVNELPEQVAKWDALLSPSPYVSEIYRRAFGFAREMVETGSPRNDLLINNRNTDLSRQLRIKLGIPLSARVVLYAPTWRDDSAIAAGRYAFNLGMNLKRIADALPDTYILARGHQLLATSLVNDVHPRIVDMTFYPDVRELYLVSDVLISDYSSVLVDYSLLRRPILCYAPDYDKYRDVLRGFYINFETDIPAPLIKTEDDVIAALKDIESIERSYSIKYDKWLARYGILEDGKSSERAVDWLLNAIEAKK